MRRKSLIFVLLCSQLVALGPRDVRQTFGDMLELHVEYKALSPMLARRAVKLYIDQFDPERLYLLQSEVKPFLSLKEQELQALVEDLSQDRMGAFAQLNATIEKAIMRARRLRAEVQSELASSGSLSEDETRVRYASFAHDERELKARTYERWRAYLAMTPGRPRDKVFALWENRHRRYEKLYAMHSDKGKALPDGEHNLCLRVLKALSRSLDAHTAYFSPEEAQMLKANLEKQFSGIGVIFKEDVGGVEIVGVLKNGPAEKSGKVFPGDILVEINGVSVVGMPYEDVLKKLQGDRHGTVRLGLKRISSDGKEILVRVDLVRSRITLDEERLQVTSEPFADGLIGKLTLPSFYEGEGGMSCTRDMRKALLELKKQGNLYGVVLDLRENLGGFLTQAVKAAGLFMSCGVIVVSKYAHGEMQYLREIDGRVTYGGPLVILISRTSASAAEIVAQALQDYGIAVVVGDERSFGKGTIQYQTFTNAAAPAFFKVTVGRYYTVSGRSTQIDGVRADIRVPTRYHAEKIGERYLEYPLQADRILSAYLDDMADIDPKIRAWFQRNYALQLQKKLSLWSQLLPTLTKNSEYRIAHSKDFQQFLECKTNREKDQFSDLQMQEAVQIVKDMIYTQGN